MKIICKFESDIISRTSLCTADTDHEMVILGNFFPSRCKVQCHTFSINDICGTEHIRKLLDLLKNLIILCHQPASLALILDGTCHVADQGKFASEQMSIRFRVHHHA